MIPYEKASIYASMLNFTLDREKYAGLKDISDYSEKCPERNTEGSAELTDSRDHLSSEVLESVS